MNAKALIDMIQDYAGFRSSTAVLRAFPFANRSHQNAGELAQISKDHELRAEELFAQIKTELKKLEATK